MRTPTTSPPRFAKSTQNLCPAKARPSGPGHFQRMTPPQLSGSFCALGDRSHLHWVNARPAVRKIGQEAEPIQIVEPIVTPKEAKMHFRTSAALIVLALAF